MKINLNKKQSALRIKNESLILKEFLTKTHTEFDLITFGNESPRIVLLIFDNDGNPKFVRRAKTKIILPPKVELFIVENEDEADLLERKLKRFLNL